MGNKTESSALKAGAWYTVSNFLMRSIGFLTMPIFNRVLTKTETGYYSNFATWLSVFTICITLNLESTFISARYDYEKDFDEYILSVLSLSTLSSMISILLLNLLFFLIQPYILISRFYLNCMLVYLVFLPAVNMFQARERYFFKYKMSVFLSILVSIGTTGLSLLLVMTMGNRLTGRIIGSLIPSVLVGIVLYLVIVHNGKKFTTKYWKYAFKICLPFIPHLLSMTLLNSMDKSMITKICGLEANATYSTAYSCGAIISLLIVSLNSAYAPWLGEKLHKKKHEEIRAFSKIYILIFCVLAALIMLLAPEVLYIIGGNKYLDALYVIPPVACGCIFQFLYTMFVNVEQFSKKTIGMAIASVSAALLNFVLNSIFIPRYGFVAAAYTTLAGFAWLLIAHMFLVRLYGMQDVYPYSLVISVALIALAFTVGVNYLYRNRILRYGITGVYSVCLLCVIIKNKDKIFSIVKRKQENV